MGIRQLMATGIIYFTSSLTYADPYEGRLTCENLSYILGSMPGDVALQCELAFKACSAQRNFNKLRPDDPLYPVLKDRLEDYNNLCFEICEMAIAVNDPDYYNRKLRRRPL